MKYVKSQRSYGFLITKELIFGFQILDLKDHFSASLKGLFRKNVNIKNQQETSLQIGIYLGPAYNFFIQITLTIVSDLVKLRDKTFSPQVIKKLM